MFYSFIFYLFIILHESSLGLFIYYALSTVTDFTDFIIIITMITIAHLKKREKKADPVSPQNIQL